MKGKILAFIIGLLVGALLATGGYYLYENNIKEDTSATSTQNSNMPENNGQMPQGGPGGTNQDGNMTEPPAKPDGDNSTTPPEMPDGNSQGQMPSQDANATTENQVENNTDSNTVAN